MKWVIVGAGPTGCHMAISLLGRKKARQEEVVLLDPRPPLSLWNKRTSQSKMGYLRSSCVHHIGLDSPDLCRFERARYRCPLPWKGKTRSPKLELFNAHCQYLLTQYDLLERWQEATLIGLERSTGGFTLRTSLGPIEAERVVLALGPCWEPETPTWLRLLGSRVRHLLNDQYLANAEPGSPTDGPIGFLGGGMTAVQAALAAAQKRRTVLFTRRALTLSEFDVTPGWMGPVPDGFCLLSAGDRRRLVDSKRHPGTINTPVYRELKKAQRAGLLEHHILRNPVAWTGENSIVIEDGKRSFHLDRLYLGTGFRKGEHPLHRTIADRLGASLADCGHPLLDRTLQWIPGLHVAGGQADLQIGPAAPNILGARLAAERILAAAGR